LARLCQSFHTAPSSLLCALSRVRKSARRERGSLSSRPLWRPGTKNLGATRETSQDLGAVDKPRDFMGRTWRAHLGPLLALDYRLLPGFRFGHPKVGSISL